MLAHEREHSLNPRMADETVEAYENRVNARALPSEARLQRNPAGLWEGTLVLTLPPR